MTAPSDGECRGDYLANRAVPLWVSPKLARRMTRRRISVDRLGEFAMAFGVPEAFFSDSGISVLYDERYRETHDGATVRDFTSAREQERQAAMIWVPVVSTPDTLLASMTDGRLATQGPDTQLAMTVGILEAYGCPTEDVFAVRVAYEKGDADHILENGLRPSPASRDLVISHNANQLAYMFVESGSQHVPNEVILRRPILMTMSAALVPNKS